MSNPVDLTPFTAQKHGPYDVSQAFVRDGHRYATDTAVAVRVPSPGERDTPTGERPFAPVWRLSVWSAFPLAGAVPVGPFVTPAGSPCEDCDRFVCPECEGDGVVVWDSDRTHYTYSDECRLCDGSGGIGRQEATDHGVTERAGDGEVCGTCGGAKVVYPDTRQSVLGVLVADKYLRLLNGLTVLRASVGTHLHMSCVLFEADGGAQGVVMGRLS